MTSVQRVFSQRNNTVTQIVPTLADIHTSADLSGVASYTFDVPNIQSSGGIYYIDLSSVDSSGNPINCNGVLTVNSNHLNMVTFVLTPSFNPAYAPGLEFTVFFKNPPLASIQYNFLTIGLQKTYTEAPPIPYIYSPPLPSAFSPGDIFQSLTFKSDGTNFNVTSSGPAGWMGVGLINVLLGFYS
jgi:hypothetical protein